MTTPHIARPSAAIAALVVVDLTTKWWATRTLDYGSIAIPGPIDLQLSYNTGTAFGLLADVPAAITSLLTGAVLIVLAVGWRRRHAPTAPIVLILAGGTANLIDRVHGTGVVDMLHSGWWPTFNVADIYITVGIALGIIYHLRAPRTPTNTGEGSRNRQPRRASATARQPQAETPDQTNKSPGVRARR
ncbi:MAG: signal peptidase II [Acidimicrobiaceae bacterium]|nr:signal peptidase II [Acidimicrobiaceae bacterium]